MKEDNIEIFELALKYCKGLTADLVKSFPEKGLTVRDFFLLDKYEIKNILGLSGQDTVNNFNRENAFQIAAEEFQILKKKKIQILFLLNEDYPVRLFNINDPPIILYKLGSADLNASHIISVVGTRKPTSYGITLTGNLIDNLGVYFPDLIVVSGLAFGIDTVAHNKSIEKNLTTVAVVAHGLDMIYPAANRDLASNIIKNGGAIVSEYEFGEKPYRQRFLERNRIVAALSDVTIITESPIKGGAMSTANLAFSYSREVMALPGRVTDENSGGCNLLIRKEKARILTGAPDIMELMGWQPLDLHFDTSQRNLFPELEGDSAKVYEFLKYSAEPVQVDKIQMITQIPISSLMSILGELEFEGIISRHPGNRFSAS